MLAPGWPGTITLIAQARAVAPAERSAEPCGGAEREHAQGDGGSESRTSSERTGDPLWRLGWTGSAAT